MPPPSTAHAQKALSALDPRLSAACTARRAGGPARARARLLEHALRLVDAIKLHERVALRADHARARNGRKAAEQRLHILGAKLRRQVAHEQRRRVVPAPRARAARSGRRPQRPRVTPLGAGRWVTIPLACHACRPRPRRRQTALSHPGTVYGWAHCWAGAWPRPGGSASVRARLAGGVPSAPSMWCPYAPAPGMVAPCAAAAPRAGAGAAGRCTVGRRSAGRARADPPAAAAFCACGCAGST